MNFDTLTRDQSRQLDRLAMDEFGMSGLVLMENAGRGAADVLCREGIDGPVIICCGKGNNAGDGFVIARHLDLRGYCPKVFLWSNPSELQGDAAANYNILCKTDVPVKVFSNGFYEDETQKRIFQDELADAGWVSRRTFGDRRPWRTPPADRYGYRRHQRFAKTRSGRRLAQAAWIATPAARQRTLSVRGCAVRSRQPSQACFYPRPNPLWAGSMF